MSPLHARRRPRSAENPPIAPGGASAVAASHPDSFPREGRKQLLVTIGLAVLILIPSMYGFVGKFVELVRVFRGEPGGAFAVAPILNYLLASLGFLCLLLWATSRGMFHDLERPKHQMLQNEEILDGKRP